MAKLSKVCWCVEDETGEKKEGKFFYPSNHVLKIVKSLNKQYGKDTHYVECSKFEYMYLWLGNLFTAKDEYQMKRHIT